MSFDIKKISIVICNCGLLQFIGQSGVQCIISLVTEESNNCSGPHGGQV